MGRQSRIRKQRRQERLAGAARSTNEALPDLKGVWRPKFDDRGMGFKPIQVLEVFESHVFFAWLDGPCWIDDKKVEEFLAFYEPHPDRKPEALPVARIVSPLENGKTSIVFTSGPIPNGIAGYVK